MKRSKKFLLIHLLVVAGFLSILVIYFLLRFYHLKSLPIFVDEAIYSQWGQEGFFNPSLRLLSLVDGKQPLYIWLISLAMNVVANPVVAARLVSLLMGAVTLVGLYFLTSEIFKNKNIGIAAAVFYVFYPFSVLLNRMALYESTVGMFFVWSLYLSVLLVRYTNIGIAFTLGFTLGAGILTKSTGFLSIYLIPLTVLLHRGKFPKLFIAWLPKVIVSLFVALILYGVLFLSKDYYMISEKNALFIYHIRELIPYHAFQNWAGNISLLITWVIAFLTIPSTLLIIIALFGKYKREKMFLFLYFLLPIIGLGLFGRLLYPRYTYPFSLILIPLIAYGIFNLRLFVKNIFAYSIVIAIVFGVLLYSDYKIVTDLPHAPIPLKIIDQYTNASSSGEGLKDILAYLQEQSKTKHIVIITEGRYGSLTTTVVEIYFRNNEMVKKYVLDEMPKQLPDGILRDAKITDEYIILNQTQQIPQWSMHLIMEHKKGTGSQYVRLFKVY